METYTLEITLESDTAFSMGAGVSGLIDSEVMQDESGFPFINGRTIKGLLVNECSELLFVLSDKGDWEKAAKNLFGSRGDLDEQSNLIVGDATLAPDLLYHLKKDKLSRDEIMAALTDTRYQTAMNERGTPDDETLRAIRTVISSITFYAPLILETEDEKARALLAACAMALRRAGLGRNRGKGKIAVKITNRVLDPEKFASSTPNDIGAKWFEKFNPEVAK